MVRGMDMGANKVLHAKFRAHNAPHAVTHLPERRQEKLA